MGFLLFLPNEEATKQELVQETAVKPEVMEQIDANVKNNADAYNFYKDIASKLRVIEKAKIRDNKFKKRIVQNPQIGFWEKVLDRIKG